VSSQLNRQLLRLSTLLQLERRARRAERAELAYVMVDETIGVLPYRQAALWVGGKHGRIGALSGVSSVDATSSFARWLARVSRELATGPDADKVHPVAPETLSPSIRDGWAEHLPAHAVWVPLECGGKLLGGLLFARAEPWEEADGRILDQLADTYAHAWVAVHASPVKTPGTARPWKRAVGWAILAAVIGAGFLPVRESVLAPAEVIPRAPELVRAPFDGVVDAVDVEPNREVKAGDVLVRLDTAQLRARRAVAVKARDVAAAEYQRAAQQGVTDQKAKALVPALQSKLEQQKAEIDYVSTLLDRAELTSPISGIAVFDDRNDWLGKPVTQGERIMLVADPNDAQLEIRLPVGDAVPLRLGADVSFFLNVAPEAPLSAALVESAYKARPQPDGVVSFRMKADFAGDAAKPRIGLKGVAKIYGDTVPAAMLVLRRPLASVRQWLGF